MINRSDEYVHQECIAGKLIKCLTMNLHYSFPTRYNTELLTEDIFIYYDVLGTCTEILTSQWWVELIDFNHKCE